MGLSTDMHTLGLRICKWGENNHTWLELVSIPLSYNKRPPTSPYSLPFVLDVQVTDHIIGPEISGLSLYQTFGCYGNTFTFTFM